MFEKIIDMSEQGEYRWQQYLQEFEEDIYPIFKRRGYTKFEAFLLWAMNDIKNELAALNDKVVYDDGDNEEEIT